MPLPPRAERGGMERPYQSASLQGSSQGGQNRLSHKQILMRKGRLKPRRLPTSPSSVSGASSEVLSRCQGVSVGPARSWCALRSWAPAVGTDGVLLSSHPAPKPTPPRDGQRWGTASARLRFYLSLNFQLLSPPALSVSGETCSCSAPQPCVFATFNSMSCLPLQAIVRGERQSSRVC